METFRKNLSLIAAVAIPVVLLALVAVIVYFRQGTILPTQDFLYSSMNNSRYVYQQGGYTVDASGKLTKFDPFINYPKDPAISARPVEMTSGTTTYPDLYLYDVQTDTVKMVTFEEASAFSLDPSFRSIDGYQVQTGDSSGLIPLFGGSDYRNRYIVKGSTGKRLDLPQTSEYYDFQFIGWIR